MTKTGLFEIKPLDFDARMKENKPAPPPVTLFPIGPVLMLSGLASGMAGFGLLVSMARYGTVTSFIGAAVVALVFLGAIAFLAGSNVRRIGTKNLVSLMPDSLYNYMIAKAGRIAEFLQETKRFDQELSDCKAALAMADRDGDDEIVAAFIRDREALAVRVDSYFRRIEFLRDNDAARSSLLNRTSAIGGSPDAAEAERQAAARLREKLLGAARLAGLSQRAMKRHLA